MHSCCFAAQINVAYSPQLGNPNPAQSAKLMAIHCAVWLSQAALSSFNLSNRAMTSRFAALRDMAIRSPDANAA